MKKKLLCITIAMMLIACMVIPALAVSGEWGGINYTLNSVFGSTTSKVIMSVSNVTVQVTARGRAYVYALAPGERMWGRWYSESSPVSSTTATLYVNNYVYDDEGNMYTGTIEKLRAEGYIGVNYVNGFEVTG